MKIDENTFLVLVFIVVAMWSCVGRYFNYKTEQLKSEVKIMEMKKN